MNPEIIFTLEKNVASEIVALNLENIRNENKNIRNFQKYIRILLSSLELILKKSLEKKNNQKFKDFFKKELIKIEKSFFSEYFGISGKEYYRSLKKELFLLNKNIKKIQEEKKDFFKIDDKFFKVDQKNVDKFINRVWTPDKKTYKDRINSIQKKFS